jgi:hypothetical protein
MKPSALGSVNAQPAWDSRTSCAKVAILDTGIQYNHPDVQANVWLASFSNYGKNGVDLGAPGRTSCRRISPRPTRR